MITPVPWKHHPLCLALICNNVITSPGDKKSPIDKVKDIKEHNAGMFAILWGN